MHLPKQNSRSVAAFVDKSVVAIFADTNVFCRQDTEKTQKAFWNIVVECCMVA